MTGSLENSINALANKIKNKITIHENKTSSTTVKGHSQAGGAPQAIGTSLNAGTDNGYYARADHVHTVNYDNILNTPEVKEINPFYESDEMIIFLFDMGDYIEISGIDCSNDGLIIDWGNGTSETISKENHYDNKLSLSHNYSTACPYIIKIKGITKLVGNNDDLAAKYDTFYISDCCMCILPNTITTIPYGCFAGRSSLDIIMPSSVTKIESYAFHGLYQSNITFLGDIPPTAGTFSFYGLYDYSYCTLSVPIENLYKYQTASNYPNIPLYGITKLGNIDGVTLSSYGVTANAVKNELQRKVDKQAGKGLSTNDYTTNEKNKLNEIEAQANKTIITNNLTTTKTGTALDASQGKILADLIGEAIDYING